MASAKSHAATSEIDLVSEYAASCEYVVVVVGSNSTEDEDRDSLYLSDAERALIAAVTEGRRGLSQGIVVVVCAPGAMVLEWRGDVGAILVPWYAGAQQGNAVADVLFGAVNPSARLPRRPRPRSSR